jgi:hypothetical protein
MASGASLTKASFHTGRDRVRFGRPRHKSGTNHATQHHQRQPISTNISAAHRPPRSPKPWPMSSQRRYISKRSTRPKQSMPSPGGQVSGMTGHQRGRGWAGVDRVGHPADLPTWSGYARSTGCPTAPSMQDHPWSSSGGNASRPPTRPRTSRHGRSAKRSGHQT